jgi:transcriptional regulator with XRE-family HTH domain
MSEIGHTISQLRRAKGWNQTELAEKAGVSRPLISSLERGAASGAGMLKVGRILAVFGYELIAVPKSGPPTLDDLQKLNEVGND